mgnify:CR=1 FL=1
MVPTPSTAQEAAQAKLFVIELGRTLPLVVLHNGLGLALGWIAATGLGLDTNFTKQLPLEHEYIQTYLDHKEEFGGANRLLIALVARDGTVRSIADSAAPIRDAAGDMVGVVLVFRDDPGVEVVVFTAAQPAYRGEFIADLTQRCAQRLLEDPSR